MRNHQLLTNQAHITGINCGARSSFRSSTLSLSFRTNFIEIIRRTLSLDLLASAAISVFFVVNLLFTSVFGLRSTPLLLNWKSEK